MGFEHPDYLLPRLSGKQLNDWMDYFGLEPWGCDAEEARTMYVAHSARSAMGGEGPDAEDYFPHWARRREDPTPEEVVENMKVLAAAWGMVETNPKV